MKLSILCQSPVPEGGTAAQAVHETVALAQQAETWGYHRFWVAEHAQPTPTSTGNPYDAVQPLDIRFVGDTAIAEPGPVSVDACAGHFDGLPAWPVSIMARDATQLAVAVARRAHPGASVRVTGGAAHTERFVFAGEAPVLRTEPRDEGLRVVIEVDGTRCAWFDMDLRVEATATRAA